MINITAQIRWPLKIKLSRPVEKSIFLKKEKLEDWKILEYSIIEYAPAIKIDNPKNRILLVLKPSKEEIQKISAKILDIGGAPIHVIIVNNQKKPNRG
jgi:hypothetical protein